MTRSKTDHRQYSMCLLNFSRDVFHENSLQQLPLENNYVGHLALCCNCTSNSDLFTSKITLFTKS